jgi:hypothetical protein
MTLLVLELSSIPVIAESSVDVELSKETAQVMAKIINLHVKLCDAGCHVGKPIILCSTLYYT